MSSAIVADPLLALGGQLAIDEVEDPLAVDQQEEGDDEDREELHEAREDADRDVAQGAGGVAEPARQLARLLLEAAR